MTTRIVFNGQEYASLDAMPPDVRQAYDQIVKQLGDADHDGVPDIVQHGIRSNFLDITRSDDAMTTARADGQPPSDAVRAQLIANAGERTWTIKVSARQLRMLLLLVLIAVGLTLLFVSAWRRR